MIYLSFFFWQETAHKHANAQGLHTVIWLSAALLGWYLLYLNFLLVSVYFTPVTWAVLCSFPMRRAQDKVLKSIEDESSVRIIALRVLKGGSTRLLSDLLSDSLTLCLCWVLVIWVSISRFIHFLGLGAVGAVLNGAFLLVVALLVYFALRFLTERLALPTQFFAPLRSFLFR